MPKVGSNLKVVGLLGDEGDVGQRIAHRDDAARGEIGVGLV